MSAVRILIDYRPALRERTGVGEHVHQLAAALVANAADDPDTTITLFSSSWRNRVDRTPLPPVRVIDRRIPVRLLNLLWHRVSWPSIEAITKDEYDVVHSPHPLLIPSRRAARVITIHDLDFLSHPERTADEVRRDYPALVRTHAHQADRIVVPSPYTGRRVVAELGIARDKIVVCPNGAPQWAPLPHPPHSGYILFVGTLEPRKNVPGLLSAYAALAQRRAEVPDLVLAGHATADAQRWLPSLNTPPLLGHVRHLGYVHADARRDLFAGARLLVLPSFDEGFGLPVLEAMTIGVPVIASDRGALPDLLGDAGTVVDPDDHQALAAAIAHRLDDPDGAAPAVARGLERARRYDWRASARILRAAYDQAEAARRRR